MSFKGYFSNPRVDLIPFIPRKKFERVLDLGCGVGAFGGWLKEEGIARHIIGVEVDPSAAAQAQQILDQVFCQNLDRELLPKSVNQIDFALCLDVLEHLQDPWSLLSDLRGRLSAEGEVFVSIPNVRNFRVVIPLLLAGRWDYQKTGILDRTHLRFFTKASVKEMFRNAGYEILEWNHTGMQKGSITFWLNVLTLGTLRGFFELQYVVRAKPLGAG